MKNFEYAAPRTVEEAVHLLAQPGMEAAVLAGGTDLVGLMRNMIAQPDRVVYLGNIRELGRIHVDEEGNAWIGAMVSLRDFWSDPRMVVYPAVQQVIQDISSIQLQYQGTLVGDLLQRPRCWFFRNGYGLLGRNGRLVVQGDNRYHAILGNAGPAKFVHASRLAPAAIALGGFARVVGPGPRDERFVPVEALFRTPENEQQREHVLTAGQLVTHLVLPPAGDRLSAAYEVRHGEGPDDPLAAAAVSLDVQGGVVRDARIVLGQVAPIPWIAWDAAQMLVGRRLSEEVAGQAGWEAVAGAHPLSHNEYKVALARTAVKRALLRAAGLETGGLDGPITSAEEPDTHAIDMA